MADIPEELTIIDHIRTRPAMFVGRTGAAGVRHLILELVANSIDCFLSGTATELGVRLHDDHIEVWDDGPGYPLEPGGEGASYLTTQHFRATADGHAPHIHLSGHGVGVVAVNALAARLEIESLREGVGWRQCSQVGVLSDCESVEGLSAGTRFRFWPDLDLLQADQPDANNLRRILFDAVHLFPGLRIRFQDECFVAQDGLQGLADFIGGGLLYGPPVRRLLVRETIDQIRVEVALSGTLAAPYGKKKPKPSIRSWANGSLTEDHGSHVKGLKAALNGYEWEPAVYLVHVVMENPQYASPSRSKLGLSEARRAVKQAVRNALDALDRSA